MLPVIIFLVLIAFCLAGCAVNAHGNKLGPAWGAGVTCLLAIGFEVFVVSPMALGYSRIHMATEEYAERLETGAPYQVLASIKEADSYIIVTKDSVTNRSYAIRVKTPPPEHFTLINGQPVAIAPPPAKPVATN